ncbi:MAG: hypothetical protein CR975_07125 [Gammaproteobacteria bacterium]|nr:MAG: hypothetical protein CR975_07125 [Gammaproteobacteria bacterium]
MLPRIRPGSFIIAVKMPRCYPKRPGQLFYLQHPCYGRIVKTLAAVEGENYRFRGESGESVTSEAIGVISEKNIIGRVVFVVAAKK